MANIDYSLVLSNNQAHTATSTNSSAVQITPGRAYQPLLIDVKLTTAFATGQMDSIKVQTATDAAFTTPIDLCSFTIGGGITQTKPATLMQLFVPYEHKDYIRLVYVSASAPTGGKVFASLNREVKLG